MKLSKSIKVANAIRTALITDPPMAERGDFGAFCGDVDHFGETAFIPILCKESGNEVASISVFKGAADTGGQFAAALSNNCEMHGASVDAPCYKNRKGEWRNTNYKNAKEFAHAVSCFAAGLYAISGTIRESHEKLAA